MNSLGTSNGQQTKQHCPFAEKCYRKNPVHFSEMGHPHLEKILENQLEGAIDIPEVLEFTCQDKSALLDQLRVLQMVMRKERGIVPSQTVALTASPARTLAKPPNSPFLPSKQFPSSPARAPSSPVPSKPPPSEKPVNSPLKRPVAESSNTVEPKKLKESWRAKSPTPSQSPPKSQNPAASSSQTSPTPRKSSSIFETFFACDSQEAREEIRRTALMRMMRDGQKIPQTGSRGEFDMKYALAAPYYVFLAAVQDAPETWSQTFSVTFPELLDTSLGEIEESLHINFMVDVGWLCLQYLLACQPAKMLILLGQRCDEEQLPDGIKVLKIEPPTRYGTHHSKISVLKYKNGVRVIVSTANLYMDDWQNRTQALWMSPHLPKLPEGSLPTDGESKTGFKGEFIGYLRHYGTNRVQSWLDILLKTDFSEVNVFFIASVPGTHKDAHKDRWGLKKLNVLLGKHAELPADGAKWPVVCQSSSIGSLGANYQAWVGSEVVATMANETKKGLRSAPNFQFIYPTAQNYQESFDMRVGSCCLPYSNQLHTKQTWLNNYCHQWKSSDKSRSKAMPHVKSYTRISPDFKRIPWMVITSANLSKAAWGWGQKATNSILSYEAGVVFFPKFLTNSTTFPIGEPDEKGNPPFPLPYDLPLTPYTSRDQIFTMDFFNA